MAAMGSCCDWKRLRRGLQLTLVATERPGERLRWEGWQTLAAIRSGAYSDGEGGGAWRRRRAAAMGRVADLGCVREGLGPWLQ